MTWTLVAQIVVVLAAATGTQRWLAREPAVRDGGRRQRVSPAERSLVRELEVLTETKQALLYEHGEAAATKGSASAALAWDAASRVEQRIATVRRQLYSYEAVRVRSSTHPHATRRPT